MTNSTVLLSVLIPIVVIFLLFWWLIKNLIPMSKEEKEIFDNNLAKKALDEIELRKKIKKITK